MGELCDWAGGAVTATPIPKTVAIAKIPAMSRFMADPFSRVRRELVLTTVNRLRGEWRFTSVGTSKPIGARLCHLRETTRPIPANLDQVLAIGRRLVYGYSQPRSTARTPA